MCKKDVFFIIGDWNAKVGSQETPGVTGKFGLGIWNEAGQRLIEFRYPSRVFYKMNGQQSFSVRDQTVNIFSFENCMIPFGTIQLEKAATDQT